MGALILWGGTVATNWGAPYPDRFVWVFGWGLRNDNDVAAITKVLETAAQHGLNGAVLSAGLDSLCQQPPDFFRRLEEVRKVSEQNKLDLIASLFSVGYGGGALSHNRHLAEGVPVENALFVVDNGQARLAADPAIRIVNGGFEEYNGNRLKGFSFHDQPGVISIVDTQVVHSGKASLRLENFKADQWGHGRVSVEVALQARHCYRMSLWVKTEGFQPAGAFRLLALMKDRELAPRTFNLPATTDWRKLTILINTLDFTTVQLYAGVWGGREGKVWLDDWTLEEVGPLNVLRRPGTPVTVRNEDGSITYEEGKDYLPLQDAGFNLYRINHEATTLKLTPGSRIENGQRLRVSWYHPMVIHDSQVTVCMAEPELYEIWEHEARLLAERLHPKRIMLNMDEIRMGGTCLACRDRNMGELLGECITKQVQILRRHNPNAQIYIWSDMLDPNHNAHGNYYLVNGDYTGSWKHVPKDLNIAVWGGSPRPKSLQFFADLGFPTLVACYYDANNLEEVKGWRQIAQKTPLVRGFMYTPWQRKYELLPAFGDLLKSEQ